MHWAILGDDGASGDVTSLVLKVGGGCILARLACQPFSSPRVPGRAVGDRRELWGTPRNPCPLPPSLELLLVRSLPEANAISAPGLAWTLPTLGISSCPMGTGPCPSSPQHRSSIWGCSCQPLLALPRWVQGGCGVSGAAAGWGAAHPPALCKPCGGVGVPGAVSVCPVLRGSSG